MMNHKLIKKKLLLCKNSKCVSIYVVFKVLEFDTNSHPDNNKGPDSATCACSKTHSLDHKS